MRYAFVKPLPSKGFSLIFSSGEQKKKKKKKKEKDGEEAKENGAVSDKEGEMWFQKFSK